MGVAIRASQAKPTEGGHRRGDEASVQQPRVPVIGLDAGCIPGTKPGCSAGELERAGRDIVRSRMALARKKLATRSARRPA